MNGPRYVVEPALNGNWIVKDRLSRPNRWPVTVFVGRDVADFIAKALSFRSEQRARKRQRRAKRG